MRLPGREYCETWYGGYAFQGAVALGLAPILLPLWVGLQRGAVAAGLVVGAFYLGQVFAPLFGWLADRYRAHHVIYFLGYILMGLGTGGFPLLHVLGYWLFCALLQGVGIGATNTICGMYIVEFKPKSQWDLRIGWLQTLYGTGQAIGLYLAAVFGQHADWGLYVSGLLMIPGILVGMWQLPNLSQRQPITPQALPIPCGHRGVSSLLAWFHQIHFSSVKGVFHSRFSLYLLAWSLVMIAIWLIFNLYPLLMQSSFNVDPTWSSLYYAFGATIGIVAYPLSGWLGMKWGDYPVLLTGIVMCVVALAVMLVCSIWPMPASHWLAPLFFILIPIAWSPLIVIGTSLVPKLSQLAQGTALGIFNASVAITSLISAVAAGYLAAYFSYTWVILLAGVSMVAAMLIVLVLWQRSNA